MFKKILYTIVIIVFIFIFIGLFLPKDVHVERSIEINRPASTVFTLVNGYETFTAWSPWVARDPNITFKFSGPINGVGAKMAWSGDSRLSGSGSQEIIESSPWSLVRTRLEFEQQGQALFYFAIEERAGGCVLTWGFDSNLTTEQSLIEGITARYFGLLFDRWIGTDYEDGLTRLKAYAELLPDVDFSDLEAEVLDVEPVDVLYIQSGSTEDSADIADSLALAYQEIMSFINSNGLTVAAQPMVIRHAWNKSGYAFDAAIPADLQGVELAANVQAGISPSGRAVRVIHRGPYDEMRLTYEKLSAYMGAHGLREGPVSWEQYISDPGETENADLITHIFFLVTP